MEQKTLTVNELFSGIGAQRKALLRLGIPHEVVGVCEIDKYAIQSYEAIFGKTYNYGDICTVPRLDYADLWTYSFPCQDISIAGNQKGISEGTRSGLLYEVQRLLEVAKREKTLPKYLLLENVKNLVGKKFKEQFFEWVYYLDELGYDTYWQVLNAKNYGIPQNRERVFAISIRKDLNKTFEFPKPEELKIRLKDILEDEVDEKYYLRPATLNYFIRNSLNNEKKRNGFRFKPHNPQNADIAFAVSTKAGSRMDDNFVLNENLNDRPFFQFDKEGIVKVREAVKKGYTEATVGDSINMAYMNSKLRRGRVGHGVAQTLDTQPQQVVVEKLAGGGGLEPKIVIGSTQKNAYIGDGSISSTLTSAMGTGGGHVPMIGFDDIRIRKLTPLECWRLMGFDDEDFYKAQQSGVSNSQLYKQAGNSIVVNVLEKIFENLYK